MFRISFFYLACIFIVTRLILYFYLGIHNIQNISYTWQVLDLQLLQNDLLESLLLLHSQPPLWNLFIGLLLKIFGGDQPIFYYFLYVYHLTLTLIIIYISNKIILKNNLNKFKVYFFIFIIFNPAIIYFESLNYYAHTIFFLSFLFFYNFYLYLISSKDKHIIICSIIILLKTLIWSAYHPVILIIFYLFLFYTFQSIRKKKFFLIFFFILFLSFTWQIKNKIIYDSSLNSFLGLNFAMTVMPAANFPECGIGNISNNSRNLEDKFVWENLNRLNLDFKHPSIYGEKSKKNSVAMIYLSKLCLNKTLSFIIQNPIAYIKVITIEFLSTHGQLTIDLGNYLDRPTGWEFIKEITLKIDTNNHYKLARQLINFFFISFVYRYFFLKLINRQTPVLDKKFITILLLKYFYILNVGLFLSKYEGTRFIYAEYVIFIFFFIYFFSKNNSLFLKPSNSLA